MKKKTLDAHAERMQGVRDALSTQLDQPPEIARLAHSGGVSPRQLERLFRRLFGESPRACWRRMRLERAARQLRQTRRGVLAVALDAGFESHAAFSRGFKRRFGCSPLDYRARSISSVQPVPRQLFWQAVIAGGLRRHLEQIRP